MFVIKMTRTKARVIWLCAAIFLAVIIIVLIVTSLKTAPNAKSVINKRLSPVETVRIDQASTYPIVDVVDGDTVKTLIDGKNVTIRLLGVNTPEIIDPRKPAECFGLEASIETKRLLLGGKIRIELNDNYERVDKYGRLLAYIWSSGSSTADIFINEYLIREGYGREYTYNKKKPYKYQELFKSDELYAQNNEKGLWSNCLYEATDKYPQ